MSFGRRPQLRDEHGVRLVIADADLIEEAAGLVELGVASSQNRDDVVTSAGPDAECPRLRRS
jgi:hypothetical protein